jgi:tRNA1(Val) A37 N6-methylase TrmN6
MPRGARNAMSEISTPAAITRDALLGGRIVFDQPAQGYRAAIDPVMLAAALPQSFRGRIADLGCGAGAASLCAAHRLPDAAIVGIERDPLMAGLARQNVAHNRFGGRVEIVTADIQALPQSCASASFDAVIANPPYLEPGRANPLADPRKSAATVEDDAALAAWIDVAIGLLRPKGMLVVIQRADRLADILVGLQARAGEVIVFPLWPKAGTAAKRVIVRARKGLRSPLVMASGLVLHAPDGAYTASAEAVLRDGQALDL